MILLLWLSPLSVIPLLVFMSIHVTEGFSTVSSFLGTASFQYLSFPQCHYHPLSMGLQIKIRTVGRKNGNEPWLDDAYSMYETRLSSTLQVETTWHKNNGDLIKGISIDQDKGHSIVLLDPTGQTMTSERLTERMYEWLDRGGSRLVFVIGGAEGLPSELKIPPIYPMLSLSSLTFTHQFARTLLMEQIYRATEIRKGSGYHK